MLLSRLKGSVQEIPESAEDSPADADWQRVWFASVIRRWTSLALLPTEPGANALAAAEALAAVGRQHASAPIRIVDGRTPSMADLKRVTDQSAALVAQGNLVIIALGPLESYPAGIGLARAASGVLLLVTAGQSRLAAVKETADTIGRGAILGSVVVR